MVVIIPSGYNGDSGVKGDKGECNSFSLSTIASPAERAFCGGRRKLYIISLFSIANKPGRQE
jgi:hypothetical protein